MSKPKNNQYKARKLYEEMMLQFQGIYPEYYGGAFIDHNDNLTVLVVEGMQEMATPLKEKGISLKPCKKSYKQLKEIMEKIDSFMLTHTESILYENFLSAYIQEDENVVIVEVCEHLPKYIDMFKEYILFNDAIKFIEPGYKTIMDTEEIACGSRVSTSKPSNISICCRAQRGTAKGFITVGHSIPSLTPGKNLVFHNDKLTAICLQMENAGMVDAAFCEVTDKEFDVTNKIAGTELELDTTIADSIVGETVHMVGWKSSVSGRVESTDLSVIVHGKYFHNLVRTKYESQYGDSGGIVYIYNPEKDKCEMLGMQKGILVNEGISFYSKANNILQTLGASRY